MLENSALSGDLIDDRAPVEITVTLEDGARRRVRVTRADHERLRASGIEVTRSRRRLAAWIRKHWWKGAAWLLTVGAAAIIGQYVAGYFADRQQALDLKASIVTTISRGVVNGYDAAFDLIDIGVVRHRRGLQSVLARNRVTSAWTGVEAEVDPLLTIHFPGSDVQQRWTDYEHVVYDLLSLAYVERGADRAQLLAPIRDYVGNHPLRQPLTVPPGHDPWAVLSCSALRCSERVLWRTEYRWLGLTVLRERGGLTRALLAADAINVG